MERIVPGRSHECEPEEALEECLAGALWELEVLTEDEITEWTIDRQMLNPLEEAGVDVSEVRREWEKAGKPSPWDGGAPYIGAAAEAARLAGFDIYDSDTRTWVFHEAVRCSTCAEDAEACYPQVTVNRDHLRLLLAAYDRLDSLAHVLPCACDDAPNSENDSHRGDREARVLIGAALEEL